MVCLFLNGDYTYAYSCNVLMLSWLQIYVHSYVVIQRVANYYMWRVLNCNLQLYYVQNTQNTKNVVYSHFCLYFGTSIYNSKHTQQKAMEHQKFRNCLTHAIRKVGTCFLKTLQVLFICLTTMGTQQFSMTVV